MGSGMPSLLLEGAGLGVPAHAARPQWLEVRPGKQEATETPRVVAAARVGRSLSPVPSQQGWGELRAGGGLKVWAGAVRAGVGVRGAARGGAGSAVQSRSLLKSRPRLRGFPTF